MSTSRAEQIAHDLGLKFTTEVSPDGKWTRFKFDFPGLEQLKVQNTVTWPGLPKDIEAPASLTDAIQRVTKWRSKVAPWLFIGSADTVATQQTFASRFTVALWNRKNAKVLKNAQKQLNKSEAYARQLAMSQPHPLQGVKVIDELTKLKEPETQELRKKLVEAAQIADLMIANARAHAGGTCSCAAGDPCDVAKSEAAAHGAPTHQELPEDQAELIRQALGGAK